MSIEAKIVGEIITAKIAHFNDKDNPEKQIDYGKVQVLVPDRSGDFYSIQNIKVAKQDFAMISELKPLIGKRAFVNVISNEYQGRTDWYLTAGSKAA